jgi:hypothetical protein
LKKVRAVKGSFPFVILGAAEIFLDSDLEAIEIAPLFKGLKWLRRKDVEVQISKKRN